MVEDKKNVAFCVSHESYVFSLLVTYMKFQESSGDPSLLPPEVGPILQDDVKDTEGNLSKRLFTWLRF